MIIDLTKYLGYIQTAEMLLAMGKATADEIKAFFKGHLGVNDDTVLASILTEVDLRIAARQAPPEPQG